MKGILINYEYCTGCHSCEVACRNELGLTHGEFGIKLTEVGPYKYETDIHADTPYEWVYNPTITKACDMCEARTAMGKMPSCVQACQAWCMYYDELEELIKKMDGKTRWALYTNATYEAAADTDVTFAAKAPKAEKAAAEKKEKEADVVYTEKRGVTEITVTVRSQSKFQAFVEEFAAIEFEAAVKQLIDQFLADEKANKFVLAAADAKDGAEHVLNYMGIAMSYDAQGTQIGGGKAYLDKGQEAARKDITIMF